MHPIRLGLVLCAALAGGLCPAPEALAQRYGGVLRATLRGSPTDLSIHEATIADTVSAMSPVYNNLVVFDVFQKLETIETVRPELADRWRWNADRTELTFALRQGVTWHDGRPFTSKDVQHTFDLVRGASQLRLKLNPRKLWYANVKQIVVNGDHEVTFKLGRPQPSLVALLAGGYSPVYPAHLTPVQWRTTALGTGPFKLKSHVSDRMVELVKNPDYFAKGRPYLDGVVFHVIRSVSTQNAALLSQQVETGSVNTTTKPNYDQLRSADPTLAFVETPSNATINIIINTGKPPFNDLRVRQAVNLAMDRNALIRTLYQGGAVPGGAMIPSPYGYWGLTPEQLAAEPGYGDPAANKAEARRLLTAAGYGPGNPLKIQVSARNEAEYTGPANWALAELKAVGVEAELHTHETAIWGGVRARREFQMGINGTGIGIDDPDAVLNEAYACNSLRNYSDYCSRELERRFVAQSLESDPARRQGMVREIDMTLQREVARPMLAYRTFYYAHRAYVKNWLPHTSIYNGWRLQEVWLDK